MAKPRPAKRPEDLTVEDFQDHPVWEFLNDDEHPLGDTAMAPVEGVPLDHLDSRVVGLRVRLAKGSDVWATIDNVDVRDPRATEHFKGLCVFHRGRCFHLARYHDVDADQRDPAALAKFLRLPLGEVFPIAYDLRPFCAGDPRALAGTFEATPRERLTRKQLVALAVRHR